jgi:signal transduction histidine kinase
MSQLALAVLAASNGPSARWAHDVRNALATVGLHLETLERMSGPRGRDIAHAAHTLMSRAAAMCSEAISQGTQADTSSRRKPLDIAKTISQIANLLRPSAPAGFEISVAGSGAFMVLADPQDVFRILFNLVHNALSAARAGAGTAQPMTNVTLLIERRDMTVTVRIADDGPGLPQIVRDNLFRQQPSSVSGGLGLSIARELAERNGGVLQHVDSAHGATFLVQLPAATGSVAEPGAFRSLGKSARPEAA